MTALNNLFDGNHFGDWEEHAAYVLVGKKGNVLRNIEANSRKCQGAFNVKSGVKTWQARGVW